MSTILFVAESVSQPVCDTVEWPPSESESLAAAAGSGWHGGTVGRGLPVTVTARGVGGCYWLLLQLSPSRRGFQVTDVTVYLSVCCGCITSAASVKDSVKVCLLPLPVI